MKFHSPLVQSATLPGPLHYLQICPPGKEVPMAVQLILPHQVCKFSCGYNDTVGVQKLNVIVVGSIPILTYNICTHLFLYSCYNKP